MTGDTMSGDLVLTAPAKITSTAKGHQFGTATGVAATGAVALADANLILYNFTATNWAGIGTDNNGNIWFKVGTAGTPVPAFYLNAGNQSANFAGHVQPVANGTYNLGSASMRWGTVYTSDLELSNGIGDWTIVEGEDDLFLYNNKRGKTYKFALTEVDPSTVPRKNDVGIDIGGNIIAKSGSGISLNMLVFNSVVRVQPIRGSAILVGRLAARPTTPASMVGRSTRQTGMAAEPSRMAGSPVRSRDLRDGLQRNPPWRQRSRRVNTYGYAGFAKNGALSYFVHWNQDGRTQHLLE